jgi:chemotaxis protein MotB
MAAGGGGSWKVAYADFVTAMMALFMVLWILNQDEKVKGAVQQYFDNPWKAALSDSTGIIPVKNADVTTS